MSKYFDSRNEADRTLCNKIIDLYEDCEFNEEEIEEFPEGDVIFFNALINIDGYFIANASNLSRDTQRAVDQITDAVILDNDLLVIAFSDKAFDICVH